jgi:bifunctional DNA-binding transcriptional regulator/antitoxin component of YhaV-PrlF toxin-antitoxin module
MVNSIVEMEKTGKIYIPKEIREKYGTRFFIVPSKDKIVLYNIPANPVEDLMGIGEKLKTYQLNI